MKKSFLITWMIIAVVLIAVLYFANKPKSETTEELAKCIGENSLLYVQLGCSHCKAQEEMFGDNKKYLNSIDCFFEGGKCTEADIKATPTWVINEEKYEGVQSIEKLRNLTGC